MELADRLAARVRVHADFPEPGIRFQDLYDVYADAELLRDLAGEVAGRHRFDHVVAIEARGFVLGTAVAQAAGAALVLARKPGKLPGELRSVSYALEYGTDALAIQRGALPRGARVLVVDDVLATGGTLRAAAELVTGAAPEVTVDGLAVLVELVGLGGREALAGHRLTAVHTVPV